MVGDEHCFERHSRSGRIALSYAGVAEVEDGGQRPASTVRYYLRDGRRVEKLQADAHHRAGMRCIACHTSAGLKAPDAAHEEQAVDIQCEDRHEPKILPSAGDDAASPARVITRRRVTTLQHIEGREEGLVLHPKVSGGALPIRLYAPENHPLAAEHHRLRCTACHSQWAPQCPGCQLSYEPEALQWDHQLGTATPGRWDEKRWNIRNDLPPLAMTAEGSIAPFIPGMIVTVTHPSWESPLFHRRFASASPHTIGPSHSCLSCHRSGRAMGLGEETLPQVDGIWRFTATQPRLSDGLPADAWTALDAATPGKSTGPGTTPLRLVTWKRS